MPGLRLESTLGHCERHALLHMAPKWFDHWTTWAGLIEPLCAVVMRPCQITVITCYYQQQCHCVTVEALTSEGRRLSKQRPQRLTLRCGSGGPEQTGSTPGRTQHRRRRVRYGTGTVPHSRRPQPARVAVVLRGRRGQDQRVRPVLLSCTVRRSLVRRRCRRLRVDDSSLRIHALSLSRHPSHRRRFLVVLTDLCRLQATRMSELPCRRSRPTSAGLRRIEARESFPSESVPETDSSATAAAHDVTSGYIRYAMSTSLRTASFIGNVIRYVATLGGFSLS